MNAGGACDAEGSGSDHPGSCRAFTVPPGGLAVCRVRGGKVVRAHDCP